MKIACLQFAPQVGDVDNNLNRADAILNKAKAADLEDLDLLVLPELAFSGYNFTSLQHIAPYLEPPGSGISSLWARTTALKYDCSVIVGYPEKVDVSVKWPASPEYYNSALVVNGDGDTIANYRKCFLYYTDETWALEGKDGFFRGEIPRLGDVAMGICMDLNPYKFEAEWDAFEFGFHALDCEANVVILTMAWTTEQDPRIFSRRPQDPDLETLVYWVQRLEPLIRADWESEVIVVFCNRCGSEDDVTYAGTSAVLGILQGEVYVYGVLGRGVKDLLVVDTDNLPPSKLTDAASMDAQRKTFDAEVAEYLELDEDIIEEYEEDPEPEPEPEPEPMSHGEPQNPEIPATQPLEEDDCAIISDEEDDDGGDYLSPLPSSAMHPQLSPLFTGRMSSLRNQLRLVIPTAPAISDPTPIEIDSAIPDSAIDEDDDIIIDSPGVTNPSSPVLPKLVIPASPWRFRKKPSSYPRQQGDGSQPQVFGGGKVCMTPITPFDTGSPIVWAKAGPQSAAWRGAQAVSSLIPEAIPEDEVQDATTKLSSGHSSRRTSRQTSREREYNGIVALDSPEKMRYRESKQLVVVQVPDPQVDDKEVGDTLQSEGENTDAKEETADHLSPPGEEKEHNPEENDSENDSPIPDLSAISAILERLRLAEGTPASSHDNPPPQPIAAFEQSPSPCPQVDRPYSPKSLNASRNQSRSRLIQLRDEHSHNHDPASDERVTNLSRGTIPISASPSVFDTDMDSYYYRPQSIPISASPSLFSSVNTDTLNSPSEPVGRPVSRMGHHRQGSKSRTAIRSLSLPGSAMQEEETPRTGAHPSSRAASLASYNVTTGAGHRRRSSLRITTTNLDEQPIRVISRESSREGSKRRSSSRRRNTSTIKSGKRHRRRRNVSRGRQPGARGTSVDRSDSVGESRSQVSLSRRRQSLQRESRPDLSEMHTPPAEGTTLERRRARTVSGSGSRRSGRRRRSAPAPLLLGGTTSTTLENNVPDGSNDGGPGGGGGGDTDIEIDNDTEIEEEEADVDINTGSDDENDDVLIGTVKRIAPDCPHHSPFRRSFRHARHHRQHEEVEQDNLVPPPPPLPPAATCNYPSSSSLLSYAVSQSAISAGAGRWTPSMSGLLSASSAEGGFSSTFSEASPMSPDPETPRFFGGTSNGPGGLAGQITTTYTDRPVILSDLVSGSTVTSPTNMYSEQVQISIQLQSDSVVTTGKADGLVPVPVVGETVGVVSEIVAGKDLIVVAEDKLVSGGELGVGEDGNAERTLLNPTEEESKGEEMTLDLGEKGKDHDLENRNIPAVVEENITLVDREDANIGVLDVNVVLETAGKAGEMSSDIGGKGKDEAVGRDNNPVVVEEEVMENRGDVKIGVLDVDVTRETEMASLLVVNQGNEGI